MRNRYGVQKKQWTKFGEVGQRVFNEVYSSMIGNQYLFSHPAAAPVPRAQWRTTCWNAAWVAAAEAQRAGGARREVSARA